MKNIKFRAWDNIKKEMCYSTIELFDDMLGFRFQHFEGDGPIFMQYTGLKDKSGTEIYEGDILESFNRKDFMSEVIYECPCFCMRWFDKQITDIRQLKKGIEPVRPNISIVGEVIGNIYEHPHLLERT